MYLEFVKVVKAEQQVVEGMLYYVTLEAKDGTLKKVYKAKVWKIMNQPKELLEFNPIIGEAPAEPCAENGNVLSKQKKDNFMFGHLYIYLQFIGQTTFGPWLLYKN